MPITKYEPEQGFPGVVGRTVEQSEPAWPAPRRAGEGAPNVLLFVLDDVGYGQLSSFGGLVETPNIDRRAISSSSRSGCAEATLEPRDPANSVTVEVSGDLIRDNESEIAD